MNTTEATYLHSQFYENLVEHAFLSELLQEVWFQRHQIVEVLRAETDAFGYDLVLSCGGVTRHVQLKTSEAASKTSGQKVHEGLAEKSSGCVIWLRRTDPQQCGERIAFEYWFFGSAPGTPLQSLDSYRMARHTKGNKEGVKAVRPSIRVIPKGSFQKLSSISELIALLFGF